MDIINKTENWKFLKGAESSDEANVDHLPGFFQRLRLPLLKASLKAPLM